VGVEAKLNYETRDNTMNPTRGVLAELALWRFDTSIGGDYDYWNWKAKALYFHPLSERWTLGLRLDLSGVDGRPPFFAYPFVKLRGIPALRYQDEMAGAAEAEVRYRVAPRWEVTAFAGLGYTSDRIKLFENPGSIYNYGLGGRYNVFQAHNVWMGIDIARGPEDWNWYIQVGHPW
jgi:outer membrane translocation and assembly module TamA